MKIDAKVLKQLLIFTPLIAAVGGLSYLSENSIKDLKKTYAEVLKLREQKKFTQQIRDSLNRTSEKYEFLNKLFIRSSEELVIMIEDLEGLAEREGVSIEILLLPRGEGGDNLEKFELRVSGTNKDVIDFIKGLEKSPRILIIDTFNIKQSEEDLDRSELIINISAASFR